MKCYVVGKQEVSFNDIRGIKLYLMSEAPRVEGFKTGDLWLGAESEFYNFALGINLADGKGGYRKVAVDLVYDYYLGSKKPSLVAMKLL